MSAACHRWGVVERTYNNSVYGWVTKLISRHKTALAARAMMRAMGSGGMRHYDVRRLTKAERGL